MIVDIVNGKDVTVRIYNGGWKLYACATSCSLTISTSTVETSTTGSGLWASFKPQKHSWNGSLEGAVNLDRNLTLYDLRVLQIAMTEIQIQFESIDEAGNSYTCTGTAIIVNSNDTGAIDSVATFSIELQGTGALVQVFAAAPLADRILAETGDFILAETGDFILTE